MLRLRHFSSSRFLRKLNYKLFYWIGFLWTWSLCVCTSSLLCTRKSSDPSPDISGTESSQPNHWNKMDLKNCSYIGLIFKLGWDSPSSSILFSSGKVFQWKMLDSDYNSGALRLVNLYPEGQNYKCGPN